MLSSLDLKKLKDAAIADFEKNDLVDLRDVKIDTQKNRPDRTTDFFEQVKNPYLFKVGNVKVKVSFCTNRSFNDALAAAILNGINYQT